MELVQQIKAQFALFSYCFNADPFSTLCAGFWQSVVGGFIAFGVLLVGIGAWKLLDYRRKLRRAQIAEWERQQSDEVGIREQKWRGDDQDDAGQIDDADMAARIRAALDERKRATHS